MSRHIPSSDFAADLVMPSSCDRTCGRGFAVNIEESEVGVVASISVTGGPHRIGIDRAASRVGAMAEALSGRLRAAARPASPDPTGRPTLTAPG